MARMGWHVAKHCHLALRIQVQSSHENVKAKRSGHNRLILALQLPADCKLWCVSLCLMSLVIFLNPGDFYTHSSSTMPQERGNPHRRSAWHTHAAHRQRRQNKGEALWGYVLYRGSSLHGCGLKKDLCSNGAPHRHRSHGQRRGQRRSREG